MSQKNEGMTLLEIIVVIVIIGVMVTYALPRMFATVEYVRGKEALEIIRTIRFAVERCYIMSGDYDDCVLNDPGPGTNNLDILDPSLNPGSHFLYRKMPPGGGETYRIVATRNTFENGDNISQIELRVGGPGNSNSNGISLQGTTSFIGIK